MRVQRFVPAVLLLALLTGAGGCMTYKPVKTDQIAEFQRKLRSEHEEITGVQVRMAPTRLEFYVTLNREADQSKDAGIVEQTRELIRTPQFQREVIEELYFSRFSKKDRFYPQVAIRFAGDRKGEADCEYLASYYGPGTDGTKDRPVDGYRTWSYYDYRQKAGKPEE